MGNIIRIPSGGGMTSTLLWKIEDVNIPTASDINIDMDVNLKEYDYLGFYVKSMKEAPNNTAIFQMIKVSDFYKKSSGVYDNLPAIYASVDNYLNIKHIRKVRKLSDTKIRVNASEQDGRTVIPTRMYGIKGKINGIEK